jgi:hypothetical protein
MMKACKWQHPLIAGLDTHRIMKVVHLEDGARGAAGQALAGAQQTAKDGRVDSGVECLSSRARL